MLRFLLVGGLFASAASAESLDAILTRMDSSSKTVTSFSANVKRTEYTAVLKESTESTGNMRLRRGKNGVTGIVEFQKPDQLLFHFTGGQVEEFRPKASILEIYEFGKNSKFVDQYLSLTFGVSGAELRKGYTVSAGGEEAIGGVKTTRLELLPKDAQGQKLISKLELWIPAGETYAIQEKVTAPSRDFKLFVYTDIKVNPNLPDKDFTFVAPKGIERHVMK